MYEEIEKAINKYISARKNFFLIREKYPNELSGNDNVIGCIGEYFALQYLRKLGRIPQKVKSKVQKGYDLIEGRKKISIKVITGENITGKTTRLQNPWDEFILITLNKDYKVDRLGIITVNQFKKALKENKGWSENPIVKRTMLNDNGLIGRYGQVLQM